MRAGDLRRRISIQSRSATQDAAGQQVTTWSDYMTGVPADIQALSGRELLIAQSAQSQVTHTITVRYTVLLADPIKVGGMRAVYVNGGVTRYFDIAGALNVDERNKTIEMSCAEGLKYV
jgi:SPP1 family predicted phage head-tail adaptor